MFYLDTLTQSLSTLCFCDVCWFIFAFEFTLTVSFLCVFLQFLLTFQVWKEIFMYGKGRKNTGSGWVIKSHSKPLLLKILVWLLAGSPRHGAARPRSCVRNTPWLSCPSALPTPGHTQARRDRFRSHRSLLQLPGLSFVPPDPFSICASGEGLYVNTVTPSVTTELSTAI